MRGCKATVVTFITLALSVLAPSIASHATTVVNIETMSDGSVYIEQHRYVGDAALRDKIAEINRRKPKPSI